MLKNTTHRPSPHPALLSALVAIALLVSSPAFAVGISYAEFLSSSSAYVVPDSTRVVAHGKAGADPFDLLASGTSSDYYGLGDGYVGRYTTVSYQHNFEPLSPGEIISASLTVAVHDDGFDLRPERVAISVNGESFAEGWAFATIFDGAVTALLMETQDEETGAAMLQVHLRSIRGDLQLAWSLLEVEYAGQIGPISPGGDIQPIPEPSAALLFGAGALFFCSRNRSRTDSFS